MAPKYTEHMSVNLRAAQLRPGRRWEEKISMRDGVKLHTVFWMPEGNGPYKVLFSRTPYPKGELTYDYQGKIFTERGYGFIYQYCRGVGKSEGVWEPFKNDRDDGLDSLNWLQAKDYIEAIGLYGFSYVAYTQWIVLDSLPDKVKTAYLVHYGTERYNQMYANGMFRYDIYASWAKNNNGAEVIPPYQATLEAGHYKPYIKADRAVWNMDLPWYREWLVSTNKSSAYWKDGLWDILSKIPSKIDIPVYIGCGWYDHHLGGMMEGYRKLSDYAQKHSCLVIGPWAHRKNACVDRVDTTDAFERGIHGYEGALTWMDRILKEGEIPGKEVVAYGIGQGWREFSDWDENVEFQKLYFAYGRLDDKKKPEPFPVEYIYDPANVIETRGAECMCYAPLEWRGSRLQPDPQYREDMISFVSKPLEDEMVIKGQVKVNLCVSTDVEDTAFIVRLMEITSEGKSYNIRTGATTLRYRNNTISAMDYTPNSKVHCEIKMWDILWKLCKGSQIRIDVASSSFPEYHIHLNTKKTWAYEEEGCIAHQKIWCGDDGSYVEVPIEK